MYPRTTMADASSTTVHAHPISVEKVAPIVQLIEGVAVEADDSLEIGVVRLRMKPGAHASRLVDVLLIFEYRVAFHWGNAVEIAEWLEDVVAERHNLGPHTKRVATALAAGLKPDEIKALLGISLKTVDRQTVVAERYLTKADWGQLSTAALLRESSSLATPIAGYSIEFERAHGLPVHSISTSA